MADSKIAADSDLFNSLSQEATFEPTSATSIFSLCFASLSGTGERMEHRLAATLAADVVG